MKIDAKARRKVTLITISVALIITLIRFIAYFITHSSAILSDALESFINLFTTGFALYSFYLAAKPKDKNHPYGHGKVEFLATGAEGALISIAGITVIVQAVYTWIFPEPLIALNKGLLLIFISGLINLSLGLYLINAGKRLNSIILQADGKHWLVDTYTSLALIVGLGIVLITDLYWIDKVLAIILGIWIIYSGIKLVRTSIAGLLDEYDRKIIDKISGILKNNRKDFWIDVHNLKIQKFGTSYHIDCHLTLPWYENLDKIHQEMDEVHSLIDDNINESVELSIHPDPCRPTSCPVCKIQDCPVRRAPFEKEVDWNIENIIRTTMHNKKVD